MKTVPQIFTSLILLILFITIFPKNILAQGTFDCADIGNTGNCLVSSTNCDPECSPDLTQCGTATTGCNTNVTCVCPNSANPDTTAELAKVFCVDNDPNDRTDDPSSEKIATAVGCIPVGEEQSLAEFLLRWGVGIGGGIAFVMIVYSGFMIISSAGNPQRLQAGRELLIASVSGLLLLVFSVFILRFIGVNVFAIPGF